MSRYSEYAPDTSAREDYQVATASEVEDLVKQRAGLKAELKARLKIERAAYKQLLAKQTEEEEKKEEQEEEEEGELLDDQDNINIQNQSDVSDSHSQVAEAPRSKLPVFKDPATSSSLKRKADGEEDAPEAKRQRKVTSEALTDAGRQGEEADKLDAGRARPTERTTRRPMSRVQKNTRAEQRHNVLHGGPTSETGRQRSPKLPVGADSAFNQIDRRNKEIRKQERIQHTAEQKTRLPKEKKNRITKGEGRAPRQAASRQRRTGTAAPQKEEGAEPSVQPKRGQEPVQDCYRSFSTAPPQTKKRAAEEDLESSSRKSAKVEVDPSAEGRSAGQQRAVRPAEKLTAYEEIFGKGKKPRPQNIQRISVPRTNRPGPQSRPVAPKEQPRDDEKPEARPVTENAAGKRKLEDDADPERPNKRTRLTETRGLINYRRACFAIAPLQCLLGVPEFANHYRAFASDLVPEVEAVVADCPNLDTKGRTSRQVGFQRYRVRMSFEEHKEEISISGYLGNLIKTIADAQNESSPFKFLQAFGTLHSDDGSPLNGESSQEAKHFVDELLQRLKEEQMLQFIMEDDVEKPTLVQELFGIKTSKHLYCTACQFSKDEDPVEHLSMNVVLPRNEGRSSLADRLISTGGGQLLEDCQCLSGKCDKRNRTIERYEVEQTSKYIIVQAPRVGEELDSEGNVIVDDNGDTISAKIHEIIEFPRKIIDLSALMPEDKQTEGTKYELFGMVMHRGDNHYDGHFIALRKVGQQWFECNDEKISTVADEDRADYDNGQLFFLRRIN